MSDPCLPQSDEKHRLRRKTRVPHDKDCLAIGQGPVFDAWQIDDRLSRLQTITGWRDRMRQLFLTTFCLVFLAELGDKTQLATFALSSRSEHDAGRYVIFAASALALICASALAVLAGSLLSRTVPHHIVRWCAGLLFIGAGVWMLFRG